MRGARKRPRDWEGAGPPAGTALAARGPAKRTTGPSWIASSLRKIPRTIQGVFSSLGLASTPRADGREDPRPDQADEAAAPQGLQRPAASLAGLRPSNERESSSWAPVNANHGFSAGKEGDSEAARLFREQQTLRCEQMLNLYRSGTAQSRSCPPSGDRQQHQPRSLSGDASTTTTHVGRQVRVSGPSSSPPSKGGIPPPLLPSSSSSSIGDASTANDRMSSKACEQSLSLVSSASASRLVLQPTSQITSTEASRSKASPPPPEPRRGAFRAPQFAAREVRVCTSPGLSAVAHVRDASAEAPTRQLCPELGHPRSRGLYNSGNHICFMNAVLQSLAHSAYFCRAVESSYSGRECTDIACELCALARLLSMFRDGQGQGPVHPPTCFLRCMGLEWPSGRCRVLQQQDAHEFLRRFIEALMGRGKSHATQRHGVSKEPSPDPIKTVFETELLTEIECSRCGGVSGLAEVVLDVSLAVSGGAAADSDVYTLLSQIARAETLQGEDAYACNTCKAKVRATKTTRFVKLPQVFVLHLKRFANSGDKIDSNVKFEEILTLNKRLRYALRAVVVHYGNTCRSGHYVAFVRSGARAGASAQRHWTRISDQDVGETTWDQVRTQEPYLLLFEQCACRE